MQNCTRGSKLVVRDYIMLQIVRIVNQLLPRTFPINLANLFDLGVELRKIHAGTYTGAVIDGYPI
jgi:hypothetical protein